MIFPDKPSRIRQTIIDTPKTPLRHLVETVELRGVSAENWLGLAKDPAAAEPIDWLARESWEFYLLCTGMIIWCVYWLGVHRGAW